MPVRPFQNWDSSEFKGGILPVLLQLKSLHHLIPQWARFLPEVGSLLTPAGPSLHRRLVALVLCQQHCCDAKMHVSKIGLDQQLLPSILPTIWKDLVGCLWNHQTGWGKLSAFSSNTLHFTDLKASSHLLFYLFFKITHCKNEEEVLLSLLMWV